MTGRWTTAVLLGVCAGAAGVPDIRIIECRLVPERCRQGETLVLRVRATASGVACMNFRLRTPYRAAKGDCPDGFAIEPGSGCAVLADGPGGNLMDNGERDRDAAAGALEVPVPTAGLGPGVHYLVVFAHNRPGEGRHVLDWRNLKLTLAEGRVTAAVLDAEAAGAEEGVEFLLPPRRPGAGGGVVCGVRRRDGLSQPLSLRLATPYTCLPEETPPGFHYDAGTKSASLGDSPGQTIADNGPLDTDPASGTIRVRLDTGTWTSGIHALTLEAPAEQVRGPYRRTAPVYRDVQIAVPGPGDHLEVRVGDAVTVGKGTHFEALVSLGNGRVTTGSHSSEDGGRTWRPSPRPAMPRPNLLGDGSLLAVSYRALPVPGHAGVFTVDVYRSEDGGRTVAGPRRAEVRVPLARGALGHGLHVGPLFGRSLVELENGDLLAGMYGWFEGDTEPDRYREGGTMRRAYVCRSRDRGETWEYLS
ncbi:MAG: exo-alpha-sialidase, partial [Lentisphaeria bacterium]|nr:exo-alpha-sialidase [Lentisphaeria bacterium]